MDPALNKVSYTYIWFSLYSVHIDFVSLFWVHHGTKNRIETMGKQNSKNFKHGEWYNFMSIISNVIMTKGNGCKMQKHSCISL